MNLKRFAKDLYKKLLLKAARGKRGNQISSFLEGSASIALMETGKGFKRDMASRLMVYKLTDMAEKERRGYEKVVGNTTNDMSKKIKVRVLHCSPNTWSAVETVCIEFQKSEEYDLKIILMSGDGYSSELAKQMQKCQFPFIFDVDYSFQDDRPDITIIYHLEYRYPNHIMDLRKYSKFVVCVPLTLTTLWYGEDKVGRLHLDEFKPDLIFGTEVVLDRMKGCISGLSIKKFIPPQIDVIFEKMNRNELYPKEWEKLKGKKIFLYMTDHGLQEYTVSNEVSFDLYIASLMDYFKKNPNIGLIIRPHFALIRELLAQYWSLEDYFNLLAFCKESSNIVWDDSVDYVTGLKICDAVLADVNTSVSYFSLASMKPIALLLRYDMEVPLRNAALTDSYYQIHSIEELLGYLNMVTQGNDPMREKRQEAFNRYIVPFDGQNGKRIKETIINSWGVNQ